MAQTQLNNIITETNVTIITNKEYVTHQAFIFSTRGECEIDYNDNTHRMGENCCAMLLNLGLLKAVRPSADFECKLMLIEDTFIRQSGPHNPYIIHGMLMLYSNPVMKLDKEQAELMSALFLNFERRLADTGHKFYNDILRISTHMLLLDLYDFHARLNMLKTTSISSSSIMVKFIEMLENKEYRENREVAYYATKLCVVPKYLSEVCKRVSGHSASYWINIYTSRDISEVLRLNKYSATEIAKMFHFTSTSYFNRYVKHNLGVYPSELRS